MSVDEARESALALPLPLYARGFFQRLQTATDASQIWERLKAVAGKVATITRRRRLAMLAIALSFPLLTAMTMVLGNVHDAQQRQFGDCRAPKLSGPDQVLGTGWHEFAQSTSSRGR